MRAHCFADADGFVGGAYEAAHRGGLSCGWRDAFLVLHCDAESAICARFIVVDEGYVLEVVDEEQCPFAGLHHVEGGVPIVGEAFGLAGGVEAVRECAAAVYEFLLGGFVVAEDEVRDAFHL